MQYQEHTPPKEKDDKCDYIRTLDGICVSKTPLTNF